jgi:hypothetical protein
MIALQFSHTSLHLRHTSASAPQQSQLSSTTAGGALFKVQRQVQSRCAVRQGAD